MRIVILKMIIVFHPQNAPKPLYVAIDLHFFKFSYFLLQYINDTCNYCHRHTQISLSILLCVIGIYT